MPEILLRTSAVFLLAGALAMVWRGGAAAHRHLLWALAIVGAIALPVTRAVLPLEWRVLPSWTSDVAVPATSAPKLRRAGPEPTVLPAAPAAVEGRTSTSGNTTPVAPQSTVAGAARGVYAAGTVVLLGWLLLGVIVVRRRVRRARQIDDDAWTRDVRTVSAQLGLTVPDVRVSDEVALPFTAGVFKPVIVVPAYALAWTPAERHAVLMHECAHISRGDIAMNLVSYLVRALYWINPLAWVAARRLRVEGEKACDDMVLAAGARASDYAEHLLQIVQHEAKPMPDVALAMGRGSDFEGRLLSILSPETTRGRLSPLRAASATVVAGAAVIALGAVSPMPAAAVLPSTPPVGIATPQVDKTTNLATQDGREVKPPVPGEGREQGRDATGAERDVLPGGALSGLMTALTDTDADVRLAATHALAQLRDTVAITALGRALREDADPRVREAAAHALEEIDDPRAVPALIEALRGERVARVRVQIISALHELEDPRAVAPILAQLRDGAAEVRRAAVDALEGFQDPSIAPALAGLVRDPDVQVRRELAETLDELEDNSAIESLLILARDADATVRLEAIDGLDDHNEARVVTALTAALSDANVDVRAQAAEAFGNIEDLTTAPRALIDLLGDSNRNVRRNAASALGEIGDERAVPGLTRMLAEQDVETRRQVAEALKEIGGAEALQALLNMLKDADPEIRRTAAEALGKRRER